MNAKAPTTCAALVLTRALAWRVAVVVFTLAALLSAASRSITASPGYSPTPVASPRAATATRIAPLAHHAGFAKGANLLVAMPGDAFEIDGNVEDGADPRPDWNTLNCLPANNNGGALTRTFVPDPAPLTIFTTGGSKDINDVSSWMHTNGNVPDKDDVTNAYAAAYNVSGDLVLAFGADRFANNGDAAVGFWFFQNEIGLNPDGTFSGVHAVGDILIISHFTNGGGTADIVVFEWVGSGGSDGPLNNITSSAVGAIALVNGVTSDPCWPYTPKSGTPGIIPEGSFIEGAINLSAFGFNNLCLSSFLVETRTSQEVSAQLKDFALGTFSTRPSADAGADQAMCDSGSGTVFNLSGSATNAVPATPAWTVVSKDPGISSVVFGDPNAASTTATVTGTGTATLRFTATSTLGCGDASDDVDVTVHPVSTADAGPDEAKCSAGDSTSFTVTGTASNGTILWSVVSHDPSVTNVDISSPTTAATDVTLTGTGSATLRLTVSSTDCGDATDDVVLTVNALPVCSITGNDTICEGGSTEFCGPEGYPFYSWSGPDDFMVTTRCTGPISTAGVYTLTVTDDNGCMSICEQTLTVNPLPVCDITGDNSICEGESTEFCGPDGLASYSWTGPDDFVATTRCITISTAGTYSLTVTNEAGCQSTCERTLTVNPLPVCEITGNDTICEGGSTEFCGPEGLASYSWSGPGGFSATTRCVTISAAGSYSLTVTNEAGCQSTCERTLHVNPLPVCDITGNNVICEGGSTDFCGPTGLASYAWSGPGGFSATTRCITITAAGTYTLTVTNENGCQSTCERTLTVNPLPECSISGNGIICAGQTTQFCGTAGMASYAWTGPGGFSASTQCITIGVAGTYSLTITNNNGCTSTCEKALIVNPLPICSIGTPVPESPICGTSGNTVSAMAGQGTYAWSFDAASQAAGWVIDSGQGTNSISYTAGAAAGTAQLTLLVTSAAGCQSMCSIDITCTAPEMEFCTLTQGAYGNPNGMFNGLRRVDLIVSLLDQGPVTIGKTTGRYITFENPVGGGTATANCIIAVMPAGGPSGAFPNGLAISIGGASGNTCSVIPNSLLKKGKFNNTLIGQVLALSLNLRLDANHPLGDHELCSVFLTKRALPGPDNILGNDNDVVDPSDPGITRTIPQSVINALCNLGLPLTVDGLLELGNRALAGDSTGGASFGDITLAVSAINEGFDECRFLISCTDATCSVAAATSEQHGDLVALFDRLATEAARRSEVR